MPRMSKYTYLFIWVLFVEQVYFFVILKWKKVGSFAVLFFAAL